MKDGAIVCNTGHFNVEIDIPALEKLAQAKRTMRKEVEEYTLKKGGRRFLLAQGRLVNLAAAEGHPASVMDMSFANQALCAEFIVQKGKKLGAKVHTVPQDIDDMVAMLKLGSMGIKIDKLTKEQEEYARSWTDGT